MSKAVKKIFGGSAPKPPAYRPPPDPENARKAIEEANAELRRKARAAGGRGSMNPTGGEGVTAEANVAKTLLGA